MFYSEKTLLEINYVSDSAQKSENERIKVTILNSLHINTTAHPNKPLSTVSLIYALFFFQIFLDFQM